MPRRSIRDIRRQELSNAAFDVLTQHGIRGTTVDRVAKQAGVSKGILLHNFKDKDALFEMVLRKSNSLLRNGVISLFRHAETPEERLYAIIVGNFAPWIFTQEVCHAWINLCADVPHNRQSQRIQTVVHARMRSNLFSALRLMVTPDRVEDIAMQFTTLIDGIWLRASLQKEPMNSTRGIDQMEQAIGLFIKADKAGAARLRAARRKMETVADTILSQELLAQKPTA